MWVWRDYRVIRVYNYAQRKHTKKHTHIVCVRVNIWIEYDIMYSQIFDIASVMNMDVWLLCDYYDSIVWLLCDYVVIIVWVLGD